MSIVIVCDVFGKTAELMSLAKELNAESIIDPYDGIDMCFKNEKQAYTYFTEKVGLDAYLAQLENAVKAFSNAKTLIGFSVGAAIVWRLSGSITSDSVKSAVCFYGSQIRHFTEVVPKFEMQMIFPNREIHFDVLKLQETISTSKKVQCCKTDYLHGFMNYHSVNFSPVAYREHIKSLKLLAN